MFWSDKKITRELFYCVLDLVSDEESNFLIFKTVLMITGRNRNKT